MRAAVMSDRQKINNTTLNRCRYRHITDILNTDELQHTGEHCSVTQRPADTHTHTDKLLAFLHFKIIILYNLALVPVGTSHLVPMVCVQVYVPTGA